MSEAEDAVMRLPGNKQRSWGCEFGKWEIKCPNVISQDHYLFKLVDQRELYTQLLFYKKYVWKLGVRFISRLNSEQAFKEIGKIYHTCAYHTCTVYYM